MRLRSSVIHNNPKKKRSNNSGASIGELHDDLLINILCRLPYETINSSCKGVSTRWLLLISNPSFVQCYIDYNKTSLPKCTSFVIERTLNKTEHETSFVTVSGEDGKLVFPTLTLNFLPCQLKVAATFKDLVLCYKYKKINKRELNAEYFICNPLTRQWVTLPPVVVQICYEHAANNCFAALICEEPPSKNNECYYIKFRVIVTVSPRLLDLLVFFSEKIGQWKNIELVSTSVPTNIEFENRRSNPEPVEPGVLVCRKIVYIGYKSSFWEFDPFCDSTATTILAKSLPRFFSTAPPCEVKLVECRGRVLATRVYSPSRLSIYKLVSDNNNNGSSSNNRRWEKDVAVEVKHKRSDYVHFGADVSVELVGVHPKNEEDEIFLLVKYSSPPYRRPHQLVVCPSRSRTSVKPLTSRLPQASLSSVHHWLEILPPPTPVPRIFP